MGNPDYNQYAREYGDVSTSKAGMVSPIECAFLHHYGKSIYTGLGALVDLGSWFGASVIALVRGTAQNANPAAAFRPVHAYDRFIWETWMDPYIPTLLSKSEGKYAVGDSFLPEFLARTAAWKQRIIVYAGDATQERWTGEPIEFIHIDVWKNWALTNATLKSFFPHLIPDRSYINHQDYAFWGCPWIHLVMFRLRDYLTPVLHVDYTTQVFRCVKEIPPEVVSEDLSFVRFRRKAGRRRQARHLGGADHHQSLLGQSRGSGGGFAAPAQAWREL
jgi:hypothetical protein